MEKLNLRLKKSSEIGLFHDSRQDVRTLTLMVNKLVEKVNELVDEINSLKKKE